MELLNRAIEYFLYFILSAKKFVSRLTKVIDFVW